MACDEIQDLSKQLVTCVLLKMLSSNLEKFQHKHGFLPYQDAWEYNKKQRA